MFKWINKQGIESTEGFILQSIGRFGYEYIQKKQKLRVDVEPLRNEQDEYYEIIYEDSFKKWLPPDDMIVISEEEKNYIKLNIDKALTFMGIKHHFKE